MESTVEQLKVEDGLTRVWPNTWSIATQRLKDQKHFAMATKKAATQNSTSASRKLSTSGDSTVDQEKDWMRTSAPTWQWRSGNRSLTDYMGACLSDLQWSIWLLWSSLSLPSISPPLFLCLSNPFKNPPFLSSCHTNEIRHVYLCRNIWWLCPKCTRFASIAKHSSQWS